MKLKDLKKGTYIIIKQEMRQISYSQLIWQPGDILQVTNLLEYQDHVIIECQVVKNSTNCNYILPNTYKFAISKLYGDDVEINNENVEFTNSPTVDILYGEE